MGGAQSIEAGVVCSIAPRDELEAQRLLARPPAGCSLVELRADFLRREEIAALIRACSRPLVVTIRRAQDRGGFSGSEQERLRAFEGALAAGARFVDVELDSPAATLAGGAEASRVILSHHGGPCSAPALRRLLERMATTGAGRFKIVPEATQPVDAAVIGETLELAGERGLPLACFAAGRAGRLSRLMALAWGSWGTYGSLAPELATAAGQPTAEDLLQIYDAARIGRDMRPFVLLGSAVFGSPSPAMHAAAYRAAGIDARYFPLECDELEQALALVGPGGALPAAGLAVTVPFKIAMAARCTVLDQPARASGAVNTVVVRDGRLSGHNTDGPALLSLVRQSFDPRAAEVAVVGAGGTARAAAAALAAAGSKVRLYNRTAARAQQAAEKLRVSCAPLDALGEARWDILVQATPLGARGERLLAASSLTGRLVLDVVYEVETPLVRDARERGLAVIDGFELLVAQAIRQFEIFTGHRPDPALMRRAGLAWLSQRQAAARS